jgi:hypothetical protein
MTCMALPVANSAGTGCGTCRCDESIVLQGCGGRAMVIMAILPRSEQQLGQE